MISELKNKGDEYWFFSMLGFPFSLLMACSGNYASFEEEPVLKIAIGSFLGLIGLGIGFLLARIFKTKSTPVKWIVFAALVVCCVIFVRVSR